MRTRWANSAADLRQKMGEGSDVIALVPSERRSEAAWRERLAHLEVSSRPRAWTLESDADLVICIGSDDLFSIATHFAVLTGRRLLRLGETRSLEITELFAETVTVFAEPQFLTVRFLRALANASVKGHFTYGIITGIDTAQVSYAAAKAVLSPEIGASECRSADFGFSDHDAACDALTSRQSCLCLAAHGNGAHMRLGDTVLCGAIAPEIINGLRVPGGCCEEHCKASKGRSLHISALRADVLGLFSCNSLSVSRQLVPTNNSLALGALSGTAVAVFANPLAAVFGTDSCTVAHTVICSGSTFGEASRLLSNLHPNEFQTDSFVLLGDPKGRMLLDAKPSPSPLSFPRLSKAAEENTVAAITSMERRLLLTAICSDLPTPTSELSLTLALQIQSELECAALTGSPSLGHITALWGGAFCNLVHRVLLDRVIGDAITEAIQRTTRVRHACLDCACDRCGELTVARSLESLTGHSCWQMIECAVCGPIALCLDGAQGITVSPPRHFEPGQIAEFEVATPPADAHMVVELREKARGRTIMRKRMLVSGPSTRVEIPLPPDLTFDQYALHAIWVSGTDIACARRMFFLTPQGGHC